MTIDVESFSIPLNREDPAVVREIHKGLPCHGLLSKSWWSSYHPISSMR